jgi:hypothetical protein
MNMHMAKFLVTLKRKVFQNTLERWHPRRAAVDLHLKRAAYLAKVKFSQCNGSELLRYEREIAQALGSPNDETTAGAFFDLLAAVPTSAKLFVRHNHKPRMDDLGGDSATRIRGSGQFGDVPDLLLELRRPNKQTNEAVFSVSKFRQGSKPDDLTLWLDAQRLRLVPLPPVIYLLQHGPRSRSELLEGLQRCFGVNQRKGDELIKAEPFLIQGMKGHTRVFEIDWEAARRDAEWYRRIEKVGFAVEDKPANGSPRETEQILQSFEGALTL